MKGRKVKWNKGAYRLKVESWNIGTLHSKSIKVVKILRKKISINFVQETKCVMSKTKDIDRYKLWYSSSVRHRNGINILIDEELKWRVLKVDRDNAILMSIKLVIGGYLLNIIFFLSSANWP